MSTALLELWQVGVTLGGSVVAHDVSLAFARGETWAVVGRSGAGKSVLMKAAAGLLPHTGRVTASAAPMVFVHQDPALLDDCCVEENIAFAVLRSGVTAAEAARRVAHSMEQLALQDMRLHMPAALPLSTQKRVALARALALQPAVLIVDEPTTGLDPPAAQQVDQALQQLAAAQDRLLIIITHSPRTLAALRPRVVVVEDGHARVVPEVSV